MSSSPPPDDGGLIGRRMVDGAGEEIGPAEALLVDPGSRRGRWVAVAVEGARRLVPVEGVSLGADGDLHTAWSRDEVRAAPTGGGGGDEVSAELAAALLSHFGLAAP